MTTLSPSSNLADRVLAMRSNNTVSSAATAPSTPQNAATARTGDATQAPVNPNALIPRPYQVVGINWLKRHKRGMLNDDAGLGKGGRATDNVLTPNGWVQYCNLSVGDKVIGSDGKAHNVIGVYHRGVLPMYRVTFSDHASIIVSGDHLWQYRRGNKRGKLTGPYYYKDHVKDTLYVKLLVDKNNRANRVRIPLVKPIVFDTRVLQYDPYSLGVLLGDGSFRGNTPHLSTSDKEILNIDVAGDKINYISGYDYSIVGGNTMAFLRKNELANLYSHEKFIPDDFKFASIDDRLAILQGLMDTDGDIRRDGTIQYCTTSERLANDVRFIVQSLGGLARLNFKSPTSSDGMPGKMAYILTLAMPNGVNPFRLLRKASLHRDRVKYEVMRHVNQVEYVADEECICIAVDAPDNLYVTEHCIVTHNTIQAATAATIPCLITAPTYLTRQWYEFIKSQFPGQRVVYATGNISGVRRSELLSKKAHWYIVNHQMFRTHDMPGHVKTIIVDESHHFRNASAAMTENYIEFCKQATLRNPNFRIYELSATPIWKTVDNLWTQLHVLHPDLFPTYNDFIKTWCVFTEDAYHGYKVMGIRKDKRAELDAMMGIVSLRRTYKQAGRSLPPLITNNISVEFPPSLRQHYNDVKDAFRLQFESDSDDSDEFDENIRFTSYAAVMRTLRMITAFPGKVDTVAGLTLDALGGVKPKPVMIFCWYKETAKLIYDRLSALKALKGKRISLIDGSIPPVKRKELALSSNVVVATIASLAEGVNAFHMRTVIFAESDYPPGSNYQALRRVLRDRNDDGKDQEPVNAYYVCVNKTIDEHILRVSQQREGTIKEVLREALFD